MMDSFEEELQKMLGPLIRYHRRCVKNISLETLSCRIQIDPNNLSRIERGEQLATLSMFLKLASELDLDDEFLIKSKELYRNKEDV